MASVFKFFSHLWDVDPSDFDSDSDHYDDEEAPWAPLDSLGLRRHQDLRTPQRLPDTPTKSHQSPPTRRRANPTNVNRKCPHCQAQVKVNVNTSKITKPVAKPKARKKVKKVVDKHGKRVKGILSIKRPKPAKQPYKDYHGLSPALVQDAGSGRVLRKNVRRTAPEV